MRDLDETQSQVFAFLRGLPGAVVGYSGGVDSTLLAVLAREALGERALAVLARSASLSEEAFAAAVRIAREAGLSLHVIETRETDNPLYRRNAADRCFFCKEELVRRLWETARAEGLGAVLLGVIADDAGDWRPGIAAARAAGARMPFLEWNIAKADVRAWARRLGLSNWDRPAEACLASRVAYGEEVTPEKLSAVAAAEAALRARLGPVRLRVRAHGAVARIEVDPDDMSRCLAARAEIVAALREAGYRYVTLDLAGYRAGSMNEILPAGAP